MSENNVSRRRVVTIKRPWWAKLLDTSAYLSVIAFALGWGTVPSGSWWMLAFAVPGVLLATVATELISLHRDRHEKLRTVAVELVRNYWQAVPDARADALDYVPADVLAEARKSSEVSDV